MAGVAVGGGSFEHQCGRLAVLAGAVELRFVFQAQLGLVGFTYDGVGQQVVVVTARRQHFVDQLELFRLGAGIEQRFGALVG